MKKCCTIYHRIGTHRSGIRVENFDLFAPTFRIADVPSIATRHAKCSGKRHLPNVLTKILGTLFESVKMVIFLRLAATVFHFGPEILKNTSIYINISIGSK